MSHIHYFNASLPKYSTTTNISQHFIICHTFYHYSTHFVVKHLQKAPLRYYSYASYQISAFDLDLTLLSWSDLILTFDLAVVTLSLKILSGICKV